MRKERTFSSEATVNFTFRKAKIKVSQKKKNLRVPIDSRRNALDQEAQEGRAHLVTWLQLQQWMNLLNSNTLEVNIYLCDEQSSWIYGLLHPWKWINLEKCTRQLYICLNFHPYIFLTCFIPFGVAGCQCLTWLLLGDGRLHPRQVSLLQGHTVTHSYTPGKS